MNFEALEQNLTDNILEAQIKLGYAPMPISLNFMLTSLNHLLETNADADEMARILPQFFAYVQERLGEITCRPIDGGFCFRIPAEGAVYVHDHAQGDVFIAALLEEIRKPEPSLEAVFSVFRSFSDAAVIEESPDDEFDYLAYFPDGNPDSYRYCIAAEEEIDGSLHISYHRFTKADYDDFGF